LRYGHGRLNTGDENKGSIMAWAQKSVEINLPAAAVWDVLRDVGNIHTRLVPGLVTNCEMEPDGGARIVTFGNGMVLREPIIAIDDGAMRVAWTAQSEGWTHHNASIQIFALGDDRCEAVWTADVLPHEAGDTIAMIMEMGLGAMKAHLEAEAAV
jgi:hypothetical protein